MVSSNLSHDPDNMELPNADSDMEEDSNLLMVDPTIPKSIYMREKTTKRRVLKDGKIVLSKAERKDKGKARFTAYMLWAKDVRQDMLKSNPDMDFATVSRRLGDLWANVPSSEKVVWKRKAKRMAARMNSGKKAQSAYMLNKGTSKFLNKNGGVIEPTEPRVPKKPGRKPLNPQAHPMTPPSATKKLKKVSENHNSPKTPLSPQTSPSSFKVTGIALMDAAAHLKLLGDNLTIIGERLFEHEGQIAVSGSLSVLLDSLLCSLGPLMCLTASIPQIPNDKNKLKDNLVSILDNIAYVMPGL